MFHLDIKRFSRFERSGHRVIGSRISRSTPHPRTHKKARWEYLHVCIDDASRIAFTDIFPNERALSAISFLQNAGKYYQNLGVKISRVMTDNGPCYTSHAFALAGCHAKITYWAIVFCLDSPVRRDGSIFRWF